MGRRNTAETKFSRLATEAGFEVQQPHAIRIENPVADKNGELKKMVTSPDFYVVIPYTGQGIHIEVTDSSGDTPHKQAQQRVVDEAGVTNYLVICGDQIEQLATLMTAEEKYNFLLNIFSAVLT